VLAATSWFEGTQPTLERARHGIGHTVLDRSLRGRSASTRHSGSRFGGGWRSAPETTRSPTVGPDDAACCAPSIPRLRVLGRMPREYPELLRQGDPEHSDGVDRQRQASQSSDFVPADPTSIVQQRPGTQAFHHGLPRCAEAREKSLTDHGPTGVPGPARRRPVGAVQLSPLARQTKDTGR
jgi:hypothetical protein